MEDWQLVLLTAGVTTLGTMLVTWIGHRMTVRQDTQEERDRHATYVATRVVCMLDPFVLRCVDVINDEGDYVEGELTPQVDTPRLEFPADLDWKTVDAALMYRTLALPNEIAAANSTIAAYAEHSGPPNYDEVWDERKFQYGRVGLYALDLAVDLRKRYELKQPDYSRWNPRRTLDAAYTQEDARRRKVDEGIKGMLANHDRKKTAKDSA